MQFHRKAIVAWGVYRTLTAIIFVSDYYPPQLCHREGQPLEWYHLHVRAWLRDRSVVPRSFELRLTSGRSSPGHHFHQRLVALYDVFCY